MLRRFIGAVLPSMLAFAFSGLYTIVDGFFIGRNIGDIGLAAVNIAYPLAALVQAVGTGIGMGGAVWISLYRGKGDREREEECLGNTLTTLFLGGLLLMAVLFALCGPVLRLSGAEGSVYGEAMVYIRILIGGSLLQLFATGFAPLIRNYEGAVTAMGSMIGGFLTTLLLDFLFVAVYHKGVAGAAAATVIGQGVTVVPCILFMGSRIKGIRKEHFLLKKKQMLRIAGTGVSPFGLTISPFIVIMLINRSAYVYGGEAAVAAYAVISYVVAIVQLLLQGIGDGSQPLMSFYLGIGKPKQARTVRNMAYLFAAVTALANMGILCLLRSAVSGFFGASSSAFPIVAESMPVFTAGFLFIAFCRTTTSYFYATKQNLFSYLLVYGEPVLLFFLLTLGLPPVMKLEGVWLSVPITQSLLAVLGMALLRMEERSLPGYQYSPKND